MMGLIYEHHVLTAN